MASTNQCLDLLRDHGHSEYGGESVTQLEHALQCANLAEHAGATAALIAASLLHDIGHLLHQLPDDAPDQGIDDDHEDHGQQFLQRIFSDDVTEPVRLHVAAKRYLCATDPGYHEQLSTPSIVSLKLQGGPMSASEVEKFDSNPFSMDALKLRRWDDAAKIPGLTSPPLEHFVQYLENAIASR